MDSACHGGREAYVDSCVPWRAGGVGRGRAISFRRWLRGPMLSGGLGGRGGGAGALSLCG